MAMFPKETLKALKNPNQPQERFLDGIMVTNASICAQHVQVPGEALPM